MRCSYVISLIAICVLSGCQDKASQNEPPKAEPAVVKPVAVSPFRITNVSANKSRIDPSKGELATVAYSVDAAALVRLQIYDGRNVLVWQDEGKQVAAGAHTASWDGTDSAGSPVPHEAYQYVLEAKNDKGKVLFDLSDKTGNEALIVENPLWDSKQGTVNFVLRQAARINVRFGLVEGPYMRTVADWVARDAGPQKISWDGWDASHVLNLAEHPMIAPTVRAYTLPQNTIFVGADSATVEFTTAAPMGQRERQVVEGKTRMFFHADQPLETRGDIPVSLSIAGNSKRDAEGRWIVSGVVPVRLDVPRDIRSRVLERRFEPAFYTDGIFVFETEIGVLPITWQWDSTVINPGEHFLTANIRGYEGNYGAATLKVWVEPAATAAKPQAVATATETTQ